MNGVLLFCDLLASWTVIGAVETAPNWMQIDYIDHNNTVDFIVIDKAFYDTCEDEKN
tara:strand:- start:148 stop:318 length:171 start_codon:yes stop_codon:yes gene_type:complete